MDESAGRFGPRAGDICAGHGGAVEEICQWPSADGEIKSALLSGVGLVPVYGDGSTVRRCINGDGFECKQRWKMLISRTRREQEKMQINLHEAIAPPTRDLLKERLIN
jgi:hypothetical protein